MNKTKVSPKWDLIWEDVKSWFITTLLVTGPLLLVSFIEVLLKQDYGDYTQIVLIILGVISKLVQKLMNRSYYEA